MSASQSWAERVNNPDDPATNSDDPRFNPAPPPAPDADEQPMTEPPPTQR